jgi:hypothetical protein
MSKASDRPILIKSVNLWWYPLTLIPLLAIFYFAFTGALPSIAGLIAVFLLFFWLFSLGFALYAKLRKPPTLRQ